MIDAQKCLENSYATPCSETKWKEGGQRGQIIYCVDIKEEKGRNEKKKILVVLLFYNQRLYP
jgi:hypothetical protein